MAYMLHNAMWHMCCNIQFLWNAYIYLYPNFSDELLTHVTCTCRRSEQKLLGGSSTYSSDPDLASLDTEEETGGSTTDPHQDGDAADPQPQVRACSHTNSASAPVSLRCIDFDLLLGRSTRSRLSHSWANVECWHTYQAARPTLVLGFT